MQGKTTKDIDEELSHILKHKQKISGELYFGKKKAMEGEKIKTILYLVSILNIAPIDISSVSTALNISFSLPNDMQFLFQFFPFIMKLTATKKSPKDLKFVTLFSEKDFKFSFRLSLGFNTALYNTISSLQIIMESFDTLLNENEKHIMEEFYSSLLKF